MLIGSAEIAVPIRVASGGLIGFLHLSQMTTWIVMFHFLSHFVNILIFTRQLAG